MIALGERRYLEIKIGTADDLQDVTEVGASQDTRPTTAPYTIAKALKLRAARHSGSSTCLGCRASFPNFTAPIAR